MSFIYKITNDINNKVYIGKTAFSIEKRFKEHCKDAFRDRNEKRPLYMAMQKDGIEHFHIEQIEECENINAADREAYWIGVYNAYSQGYNATLGGDGKFLYNYDIIALRLQEHPYSKDIADEFGCCIDTIQNIAKQYNIKLLSRSVDDKRKTVTAFLRTGEKVKDFASTELAAEWCFAQGKCKTLNSGVRAHIAEVANGKRKSAYGYIWKY